MLFCECADAPRVYSDLPSRDRQPPSARAGGQRWRTICPLVPTPKPGPREPASPEDGPVPVTQSFRTRGVLGTTREEDEEDEKNDSKLISTCWCQPLFQTTRVYHNNLREQALLLLLACGQGPEVQRGSVMCPRLHSVGEQEPGFKGSFVGFRPASLL